MLTEYQLPGIFQMFFDFAFYKTNYSKNSGAEVGGEESDE